MTVTIHLPPDIEAGLVSQARDHGLDYPNTLSTFSGGRFLRVPVLPFHRPSGPPRGVSQCAASPIRRLSRMTRSAAKASTAITGR